MPTVQQMNDFIDDINRVIEKHGIVLLQTYDDYYDYKMCDATTKEEIGVCDYRYNLKNKRFEVA